MRQSIIAQMGQKVILYFLTSPLRREARAKYAAPTEKILSPLGLCVCLIFAFPLCLHGGRLYGLEAKRLPTVSRMRELAGCISSLTGGSLGV